MSRFVRHRFMPMAVGYAALRRCHQFECIFLFCLSHLHNDPAIKREYFELLKVFDSICTLFGTLLSLARAIFVLAVASGGNHLSSKILQNNQTAYFHECISSNGKPHTQTVCAIRLRARFQIDGWLLLLAISRFAVTSGPRCRLVQPTLPPLRPLPPLCSVTISDEI